MNIVENPISIGETKDFWDYFEKITQIPHRSGNEDQIRNFIKEEAEKYGFDTLVDEIRNIAVIIPSMKNNLEKQVLFKSNFTSIGYDLMQI